MLIQYSTNCISKWLSEFGCLTKLSTELFNGMKVYSHLIYCPSQTKYVSFLYKTKMNISAKGN